MQQAMEIYPPTVVSSVIRKIDVRLMPFIVLLEFSSYLNRVCMGTFNGALSCVNASLALSSDRIQ
jgi:hypothetical protein